MWRLIYFIPIWALMGLLNLVLILIGIPFVAWHAWRKNYLYASSLEYPDGRQILVWQSRWMWLWGNEEDGINGLPRIGSPLFFDPRQKAWYDATAHWSEFREIFIWAGWRNSVSNLRFVRPFGFVIIPIRVRVKYLGPTPHDEWLCWQGLFAGVHFERWGSVWSLGWKVKPEDRFGLTPGDGRIPACGFGMRRKRV